MPSPSIDLSRFKEKICLSNRESLDICAYRMDGTEKMERMAKYADLGTPSCCDYLYIKNQRAVLIEDTHLENQIRRLLEDTQRQSKSKDSNEEKRMSEFSHAKNLLKKEVYLKVYGALLILCRLAQRHIKISEELNRKKFSFWFIINDKDNILAIDNTEIEQFLKLQFKQGLSGTLRGAKLVEETKVLFSNHLEKELRRL